MAHRPLPPLRNYSRIRVSGDNPSVVVLDEDRRTIEFFRFPVLSSDGKYLSTPAVPFPALPNALRVVESSGEPWTIVKKEMRVLTRTS